MNDIRFAFRKLRQTPAFAFIAIVTLALGIGLNTAIFSLINDLFLKGLPFQEPERVLHILTKGKDRTDEFQMSAPRFMLYRDAQTIFSGFSHERMMRGSAFLRVIGRLKAGITLNQAKAVLGTLEDSYSSQFPEKSDAQNRNIIKTLPEDVTENLRPGFATLLTAVGFVLLIACSNVANLLLVRFSGRRREISLRLALGATRGSVLRLFVFESVLISLLAGVLGAALAWQLVPLVPKLAANFLPIEQGSASALSVPVLLFTIGLSLLTGFAMGLYPALQSSRADIDPSRIPSVAKARS